MNSQGYRCTLHQESFQFFCERCLQPVCRQCTIIGPHHTEIHSLSKINIAYERKVSEIKQRIQSLIERNRQKIFKIITQLNSDIEMIELIKKSVDTESNQEKEKIVNVLMKQYQNNKNALNLYRQSLTAKSNQINDLGFRYQTIETAIQLLGSHQKIMHQLKELHDRVQIMLDKNITLSPLPKHLTQMRIMLKEIQCLNELFEEKIKIIGAVIKKTNALAREIPVPSIDHKELLVELNRNLSAINHMVCHFCGVTFSWDQANKGCEKNNSSVNFGISNPTTGFCEVIPDTNKIGTHRHCFGEPKKNNYSFYGNQAVGSFKIEMETLFLKTKALIIMKSSSSKFQRSFTDVDKTKSGFCPKIIFDFIFIQQLGLSERQKHIILSIAQPWPENPSFLSYKEIVQEISKIDI